MIKFMASVIWNIKIGKISQNKREKNLYIYIAERVAELDAIINLINDPIAYNTVRSTNNSGTIKHITSSIRLVPDGHHYIACNTWYEYIMQPQYHTAARPCGPAESSTCTVVTSAISSNTTSSTTDGMDDYDYVILSEPNYVRS